MVIIFTFFAIIVPCYVYSPKSGNIVVLITFAAVNGIMMYVLLALQNPFDEPFAIDLTALENLLVMIDRAAQ